MTDTIGLASRLAGAAWGHLIGDAVGVPYEFGRPRPPETVAFGHRGAHGQPAGTWSDDGALMLALLDSLLEVGFLPADQGRRALGWYQRGRYTPDGDGWFDIGNTTRSALESLGRGAPAIEAGPADDQACGNGSLMRILPLALVGRDWPDAELVERAHLASRLTHGHPRCQVTCAVYSLWVRGLLRGAEPAAALADALAGTRRVYREARSLAGSVDALDELEGWTTRSGSGFVLDSFWSAWDAFAGAADYADTVRRAVAFGHDTDTTAAIAGGLAGAHWGWESIPPEWRRRMRGHAIATPIIDGLVGTTGARTSTGSRLRVDWLDLAGVRGFEGAVGRAGITFLPGKKRDGWTGPHWRDLDLDLERLHELRIDALFLLVEDAELDDCHVPELPEVMGEVGPELVRFPIRDPRTPADPVAFRVAVHDLAERVQSGQSVAIACRGGLDRSGMTAACLLRETGLGFDDAIARVQAARKGSITSDEQQAFVRAWPPEGTE